jgi:hypothetical protein
MTLLVGARGIGDDGGGLVGFASRRDQANSAISPANLRAM